MIVTRSGAEAAELVNPFYARHGSQSLAREQDLFFLALGQDGLLGCVRFCFEERTPMLRSMMIREDQRGQGLGLRLLEHFVDYLDAHNVRGTYCIPYGHLEKFYNKVGFVLVNESEAPEFLQLRLGEYRKSGKKYLCMRRP